MMKIRPFCKKFSMLGINCLVLGALSYPAWARVDEGQGPESRESPLHPIKVVSTVGNVTNAEALVVGQYGYAPLSWSGVGPRLRSFWTTAATWAACPSLTLL